MTPEGVNSTQWAGIHIFLFIYFRGAFGLMWHGPVLVLVAGFNSTAARFLDFTRSHLCVIIPFGNAQIHLTFKPEYGNALSARH